MKTFAERLKEKMQAQGLTSYRLAKKTGVNVSYISNVFHGRRKFSDDFLKRMADVKELDLSYDELQSWLLAEKFSYGVVAHAKELIEKDVYRELVGA